MSAMRDTLTAEDLVRLVDSLGPRQPVPVLIVCRWMQWMPKEMECLRREKDGRDEWRVSERAWCILEGHADRVQADAAIGTPFGGTVEHEDSPPADLIEQLFGPQRNYLADWGSR
jgi:hypothetical protein